MQLLSGDIDWDFITFHLDPSFQKRWKQPVEYSNSYESQKEVNWALAGYQKELYVLYAQKIKRKYSYKTGLSSNLYDLHRGVTFLLRTK